MDVRLEIDSGSGQNLQNPIISTVKASTYSIVKFTWDMEHCDLKTAFTDKWSKSEIFVSSKKFRLPYSIMAGTDNYVMFLGKPEMMGLRFGNIYSKVYLGENPNAAKIQLLSIELCTKQDYHKSKMGEMVRLDNKDPSIRQLIDAYVDVEDQNLKEIHWFKDPIQTDCQFSVQSWVKLMSQKTITFCLKLSHPLCGCSNGDSLLKTNDYFLSENCSDVKIDCGTTQFVAHKLILSNKSTVLKALLENQMKTSKVGRIVIDGTTAGAVKEFLSFIYTGHANIDKLNAIELCMLAYRFKVIDLQTRSERLLLSEIKEVNFDEIYQLAKIVNSNLLLDGCYQFFKSKKRQVIKDAEEYDAWIEKYPDIVRQYVLDN